MRSNARHDQERKTNDPGYFSTSCNIKKEKLAHLLKIVMRTEPAAVIVEGITDSSCGLVQPTCERTLLGGYHVDWWIYKDAKPYASFKRC